MPDKICHREAGEAGEAGCGGPCLGPQGMVRAEPEGTVLGPDVAGPDRSWPGPSLFSRRCSGPVECPGQAAREPAARF